jgi:hypothetical protein
MSTSSKTTPRIFTRGETTQFQVGFFEDPEMTVALVAIDPTYPQYTIYNPEGTAIQTGVGIATTPGNFKVDFLVPQDAPLSYFGQAPQQYNDKGQGEPLTANEARYRIEWLMVTAENFQPSLTEEFDVRDVAITQSQSRELKYLTLAGSELQLLYCTTVQPYFASVKLLMRGQDDHPVADGEFDSTQAPGSQGDIEVRKDGDSYVLCFDVDEEVTKINTAYIALWKIQETEFSVPRFEYQVVVSITPSMFPMMVHLRMLIDRFQKRLGRLQAYEDSDLLEYISQGTRQVNLSYPTTSWPVHQMPDDLSSLVLLAAGWWGLQAQQLLETDLDFNFSGQSVTLGVDRVSKLDSVARNMMELFNKQIAPAKMAYVRKARGVGTFAGRSYSYRNQYNYVFKISSLGSSSLLLNTLAKIGLL